MRTADQLQVGGKAAVVAIVVARMLDGGRHEAGAGERGERVVMAEMRAAGAVRVHDQRIGSGCRGGPARRSNGEGTDLRRAAVRLGGIEDDGRHRPALDGIGELQIQEAGTEVFGADGSRTACRGRAPPRARHVSSSCRIRPRSMQPATRRSDSMKAKAARCSFAAQSSAGRERGTMAVKSPLVIVLMGVSGCGKSTTGAALSRRLGWPFRDADSFHPPANVAKMSRGVPLTDEDRWPWLDAIAQWIDERVRGRRARHRLLLGAQARLPRPHRRREEQRAAGLPQGRHGPDRAAPARHASTTSCRRRCWTASSPTLQEPGADEGALIVSVAMSPRRVVGTIVERLGLEPAPARGES